MLAQAIQMVSCVCDLHRSRLFPFCRWRAWSQGKFYTVGPPAALGCNAFACACPVSFLILENSYSSRRAHLNSRRMCEAFSACTRGKTRPWATSLSATPWRTASSPVDKLCLWSLQAGAPGQHAQTHTGRVFQRQWELHPHCVICRAPTG